MLQLTRTGLAIPLTAGIKVVCDRVKSLQCYGRLLCE